MSKLGRLQALAAKNGLEVCQNLTNVYSVLRSDGSPILSRRTANQAAHWLMGYNAGVLHGMEAARAVDAAKLRAAVDRIIQP